MYHVYISELETESALPLSICGPWANTFPFPSSLLVKGDSWTDISITISKSSIPKLAENNVIPSFIFLVFQEQRTQQVFSVIYSPQAFLKVICIQVLDAIAGTLLVHWGTLPLDSCSVPHDKGSTELGQSGCERLLNLYQSSHGLWHPDSFPSPTALISHFDFHETFPKQLN